MGTGRLFDARRDIGVALALALLLGLAWTIRDWPHLAVLRLPDTDDGMRLQQVRDWLAGQSFADLSQHRLGPRPGLTMHWSRVADLLPAGLILILSALLDPTTATVTAVIVVPILYFALALLLLAAIGRRLGLSAIGTMVIGGLAFPATTLFLPGRIDHHGLQLVLVLALLRSAIGSGSLRDGVVAGLATALSLAIGLETAPLLAAGGVALSLRWLDGEQGGQARLAGYAVALLLALAAERAGFASLGWRYYACDGFTAVLWRAAMCVAMAPAAIALAGFAIQSRAVRCVVLLGVGCGALVAALWISPACLSPYGDVDPVLARRWLANVAEAQPLFAIPFGHGLAQAGLALIGLAAALWLAWRRRSADWAVLLGFQITAMLVLLVQLRGAPAAAILATPALAAMIAAARARSTLALALAWPASAGILYGLAGDALAPRTGPDAAACTAPATLARIAALPPGLLAAPVDLSAFALPASRHRLLAGPYHRNTQGNRAMVDLFLTPPAPAETIARRWGVDYVALCPDGFDELGAKGRAPDLLAGALRAGQVPGWLAQVSAPGETPRVYRLVGRETRH